MKAFKVTINSTGVRPGARVGRMIGLHTDVAIIFAEDDAEKETHIASLRKRCENKWEHKNFEVKEIEEIPLTSGIAIIFFDVI